MNNTQPKTNIFKQTQQLNDQQINIFFSKERFNWMTDKDKQSQQQCFQDKREKNTMISQ